MKLLFPTLGIMPGGVPMHYPTGQRFCVVRAQRLGFPKNANRWD